MPYPPRRIALRPFKLRSIGGARGRGGSPARIELLMELHDLGPMVADGQGLQDPAGV